MSEAEAKKRQAADKPSAEDVVPAESTVRALWAQRLLTSRPLAQRAGYQITDDNRVELYVVGDEAQLSSGWETLIAASGYDVTVIAVKHPKADLEKHLESYKWPAMGVPREWLQGFMGVELDIPGNGLRLNVLKGWVGNADEMSRHLGVPVTVTVVDEPAKALWGRFEDNPPRWGGSRIKLYWPGSDPNDPNSLATFKEPIICTSGFPAIYNGMEVMTTAGHCAPYGAASTPRWAWNGKSTTEGGILCSFVGCRHRVVGSVWKTTGKTYTSAAGNTSNPSVIDMAWAFLHTTPVGGNYGATYYIGTTAGDATHNPNNTYPSPATDFSGMSMCVSGATTFKSCGWKVDGRVLQVLSVPGHPAATDNEVQWIYTYGWKLTSTQGGCVRGGDSGGPVWFVANDGKLATVGVLSGASSSSCSTTAYIATWADARIYHPSLTPKLS